MSDRETRLDYWLRRRSEIESELAAMDVEVWSAAGQPDVLADLAERYRRVEALHRAACRHVEDLQPCPLSSALPFLWAMSLLLTVEDCHADC